MIVLLGKENIIYTNDKVYVLDSICKLKQLNSEKVILLIDNDINLKEVINDNIYIDEVLITLNIELVLLYKYDTYFINKLNNYNIKYLYYKNNE